MKTADFEFELPPQLIASRPAERREDSRLMVVRREPAAIFHHRFADFPALVMREAPSALLVLNDTRVVRARFYSDDRRVELLRLESDSSDNPRLWTCLVRPGRRMRRGDRVCVGGVTGKVLNILERGERVIEFDGEVDIGKHGHLALPPYLGRGDDESDRERYQTVYARQPGAIAAPTAGLHFTAEILSRLDHVFLTLHVGVGTFQPVRSEEVEDHEMLPERYEIGDLAAGRIREAGHVLAVGTTVTRVLEHCAAAAGGIHAHAGETGIFIYPPYAFRAVNSLLTNFHLPRSTLFMLVCAFAGADLMKQAYAEAIREGYRFYSYGDCMWIV